MSKTKWYTRALYLVFALALAVGVAGVPAAPASADVSQPTVTLDDYSVSAAAQYTIKFDSLWALNSKTITVKFPTGTTVPSGSITITLVKVCPDADVALPAWEPCSAATGDATARTIVVTMPGSNYPAGIHVGVKIDAAANVLNPATPGDYTLQVKTQEEPTYVESESYTIMVPGKVERYNSAGTYLGSFNTITEALAAAEAEDVLKVGPGTYTPSSTLTISDADLTLESTDGAAETIIDASGVTGIAISITVADVTIDGFTVQDADARAIQTSAEGTIIQNNIITREVNGQGINLGAAVSDVTVSGNELDINSTMYLSSGVSDCTLSGNTFGAGINLEDSNTGITITGNTIIGSEYEGISFCSGTYEDILIQGNTISQTTLGDGIGIRVRGTGVTEVLITGNDITDNEGVGILVEKWATSNAIKFNNITGNDTTNGYGIENSSSVTTVDATHNWWGSTSSTGIAAMINDTAPGTSETDYEPFLTDTVDAVFSATAVDTATLSLDAETDVGVEVLGIGYTPYVVSAAKYIANPGAPIDNALAFYDVYVTGTDIDGTDEVILKFYAAGIDENSVVYAWNELYDTWQACDPQDFSFWGGYTYVTIHVEANTDEPTTPTIEALTGLPFAISGVAPAETILDYYRGVDGVVSTSELLTAITDWAAGTAPSGFTEALTTSQLLTLITEWAS